jgi:hypothetical protein
MRSSQAAAAAEKVDRRRTRQAAAALGAFILGLAGVAAAPAMASGAEAAAQPPAQPAPAAQPAAATQPAQSVPPAQPWQVAPRGGLTRPVMPDRTLDPPASVVPVLMLYGQGVQRYVCKEKPGTAGAGAATAASPAAPGAPPPAGFEWTLKEPVAKLFDGSDHEVGAHSAGPMWRLADGSQAVKKKLVASVPALQFDGVPWLLIEIESSGKGGLAGTTYVQRLDTVGGAAPSAGCDAAHAGATTDVEYRATYLFYAPRPKP